MELLILTIVVLLVVIVVQWARFNYIAKNQASIILRLQSELNGTTDIDDLRKYSINHKHFHKMLCERFNYSHDDEFWWRDQVSLIEHISNKLGK